MVVHITNGWREWHNAPIDLICGGRTEKSTTWNEWMRSRRQFLLGVLAAATLLLLPAQLSLTEGRLRLTSGDAQARGGGGKGGSSGGGRGGGNGGRGGKSGGGRGGGGRGGRGRGSRGERSRKSGSRSRQREVQPAAKTRNSSITVRHANGTTERIASGRYEMKDSRDRTIVNRRATASDRARLRSLRR